MPRVSRIWRTSIVILGLSLCALADADADVYVWTDREGVIHMTNDPNSVPAEQRGRVQVRPEAKPAPPSKVADRSDSTAIGRAAAPGIRSSSAEESAKRPRRAWEQVLADHEPDERIWRAQLKKDAERLGHMKLCAEGVDDIGVYEMAPDTDANFYYDCTNLLSTCQPVLTPDQEQRLQEQCNYETAYAVVQAAEDRVATEHEELLDRARREGVPWEWGRPRD